MDRVSTEGNKNRTNSIKRLFKAAVGAVVARLNPEPQSEARKRRSGEKEGGGPIMMRPVVRAAGRPAARGPYAALQTVKVKAGKIVRRFSRAANDATVLDDVYDDTALYLADTLAALNQQNDAALADAFDGTDPSRHNYVTFDL